MIIKSHPKRLLLSKATLKMAVNLILQFLQLITKNIVIIMCIIIKHLTKTQETIVAVSYLL